VNQLGTPITAPEKVFGGADEGLEEDQDHLRYAQHALAGRWLEQRRRRRVQLAAALPCILLRMLDHEGMKSSSFDRLARCR
jgi:hypothetical protein